MQIVFALDSVIRTVIVALTERCDMPAALDIRIRSMLGRW